MARRKVSRALQAVSRKTQVEYLKHASSHSKLVAVRVDLNSRIDQARHEIALSLGSTLPPAQRVAVVKALLARIAHCEQELLSIKPYLSESSSELVKLKKRRDSAHEELSLQEMEVNRHQELKAETELLDRLSSLGRCK